MTYRKFILLVSTLLFSTYFLSAKDISRDISASFRLSKSVHVLPYKPAILDREGEDFYYRDDLANGTFGISVDLLYRARRRNYYNFAIEHNFVSFKDEALSNLSGEELAVSYTSVLIGGTSFINKPDEFTPYFGYGVDIMFFTSNQSNVFRYEKYYPEPQEVEFFGDVNVALMLKAGLTYPLNKDISLLAEFDVRVSSSEYLGVISKFNIGSTYWFK
jgi:hypothetical protein